ncbi:MAG: phage terminase large subunit family protein [Dongiaceae bacterium]
MAETAEVEFTESRATVAAIRASTLVWIEEKKIVNEKGKRVDLGKGSPHFFMRALYRDRSQEIAVQKPSQAGVSTWAILTELHDGRYWGINQIHTLPTKTDVEKFVPSKVNEIIERNPVIKQGLSKKEVNAVAQKQLGKGFLYYKGTISESDSLMLTSDRNTYDELDKSDMKQIANYGSRQEGADSWRQKRWISTPTVPEFGINKVILESDQKHWRFNCPNEKCGFEQHMEWPANVSMERKCYVCKKCDAEITKAAIRKGRWKAKYPHRSPDPKTGKGGISGYLMTQMIFPWIECSELIEYYNDAVAGRKERTLEYFFNHKIGVPYVSASSRISSNLITSNCITRDHLEINSCMGVDVQETELYLIIGSDEGAYVIARVQDEFDDVGRLLKSKWDRWAELMEVYDVRYCVIDGGYKPNDVQEAAARFPGRVWINWYKDDPKKAKIVRFADEDFTGKQLDFEEEIKILTERDRMIDFVLNKLTKGGIRFFYGPADEAIKLLIEHVSTTYARTITDRVGKPSREWVSTGKDDLLHALIYFVIALMRKERNEQE